MKPSNLSQFKKFLENGGAIELVQFEELSEATQKHIAERVF